MRVFIDGVIGKNTFDQFPAPVRERMLANAQEMKAETSAPGYFPVVTCEDVQQITAPTLLVTGEWSPRMFHVITDELERCLPNCERAMIPKASHGMAGANPTAFNETVLAFLRNIPKKTLE